jgi:sec-independent protein translocase protein TatC
MTLVEHLDELRTRVLICVAVLVVSIGLCFWQNSLLLDLANRPLPEGTVPVTLSPTEPLMTTLTVSGLGGLMLALPVLLYQVWAFVLPAFSPSERRAVLPLVLSVPFLFISGVLFAYFVLMPVAIHFLLSFNVEEFAIEVRARDYYSFLALSLLAIGILFQIPVAVLALSRLGIITPESLARNRRYAVLGIAIVAMLVTSPDPATMIFAMLPVYGLFEASIVLARRFGRPPPALEEEEEVDAEAPGRTPSQGWAPPDAS